MLTGSVTLILVLVDIVRIVLRGGAQSGSWIVEGGGVKVPESRGREIAAISLVAAGVAGVYLLGFLLAIPLYLLFEFGLVLMKLTFKQEPMPEDL